MKKNCLVTKLKATVDNSDLLMMNELRFTVTLSTQQTIALMALPQSTFTVKVISGDITLNGQTSLSIPYNDGNLTSVVVAGTNGVLSIDNKYKIRNFSFARSLVNAEVKISEIRYLTNIVAINCNAVGEAGLKPNWSSVLVLNLYGDKMYGQLSDLLYNIPDKQLKILTINNNSALKGSMSDISKKTSNANNLPLNLSGCTGITGSVAEYVSVKRAQGENEGSINLQYIDRYYIKANDNTEIPAGSTVTVTWTSNNKIKLQGDSQVIEIDG